MFVAGPQARAAAAHSHAHARPASARGRQQQEAFGAEDAPAAMGFFNKTSELKKNYNIDNEALGSGNFAAKKCRAKGQ